MDKNLLVRDAILAVILFLMPVAVDLIYRDKIVAGLSLVALLLISLAYRLGLKLKERKIQK